VVCVAVAQTHIGAVHGLPAQVPGEGREPPHQHGGRPGPPLHHRRRHRAALADAAPFPTHQQRQERVWVSVSVSVCCCPLLGCTNGCLFCLSVFVCPSYRIRRTNSNHLPSLPPLTKDILNPHKVGFGPGAKVFSTEEASVIIDS
jgi:hypothetical protein